MSPYRDAVATRRWSAAVDGGALELEVRPGAIALRDGRRTVDLVPGSLVTTVRGRGRAIRRERSLAGVALYLARSHPGRGLALWGEVGPDRVERLWAVDPRSLLEADGLAAARAADVLAARLGEALVADGHGGSPALELGRGGHRVLLVERGDRSVLYARPLFRERPRRCLELWSDGGLVATGRGGARVAGRVTGRFDITASGDRIGFADARGDDVVRIYLPWIAAEDRVELARRFADLIDPGGPVELACAPVSLRAPLSRRLAAAWPLPRSRFR